MRVRAVIFIAFLSVSVGCTGTAFGRRFDPHVQIFSPELPERKSEGPILDNETGSVETVVRPQAPPAETPTIPLPEIPTIPAIPEAPRALSGTGSLSWPTIYGDEHRRTTPTVRGDRLGLGPADNGVEKAVELARKNEQLQAEVKALLARIAGMEQLAKSREEAVAESLREVEIATVEVIRARADLKSARLANDALKDQMRQTDQEDLETLKAIVAALEKLLDAPRD